MRFFSGRGAIDDKTARCAVAVVSLLGFFGVMLAVPLIDGAADGPPPPSAPIQPPPQFVFVDNATRLMYLPDCPRPPHAVEMYRMDAVRQGYTLAPACAGR